MCYTDSNYANDTKSKQSIMGYIYCLNRVTVSWPSKRAKTIAVSSIKAKYAMLNNALKQAIWMKKFIKNF